VILRAVAAELIGTALLLATVVGSGIMGERLATGNAGIALLVNAAATGAILYVLIVVFAPVSGAQFNPVVSLASAWRGMLPWRSAAAYVPAQLGGAFAGVVLAHAMFGLPALQVGAHLRSSAGEFIGEIVATFGLLLTIVGAARERPHTLAAAVACYIAAAYWFTSSTSFTNPAVTLARALSNTFAGIAPESVPLFLCGQLIGAIAGVLVAGWLFDHRR
jgi:glycerol uptake facilitator-like aquaporin